MFSICPAAYRWVKHLKFDFFSLFSTFAPCLPFPRQG